jgi:hypothetical protein
MDSNHYTPLKTTTQQSESLTISLNQELPVETSQEPHQPLTQEDSDTQRSTHLKKNLQKKKQTAQITKSNRTHHPKRNGRETGQDPSRMNH